MKRIVFTAGQFAKLHNINKRTLHYYDQIGLFSPSYKGENGYRYYTYLQSPSLEMILALRELGMSIYEIQSYMGKQSSSNFRKLIFDKTTEIDETIKQLKEIKKLLQKKESLLTICEQTDLNRIDLIDCKEEYLLLSGAITGAYDDNDFAVLMEHTKSITGHHLHNKSYGSMISSEKIMSGKSDDYDCFFTKLPKSNKNTGLFIKPSGKYIRAFCKGNWDKLPLTYRNIVSFAEKNNLKLKGYSYEEGINEMAIQSIDEYVTQISILCE